MSTSHAVTGGYGYDTYTVGTATLGQASSFDTYLSSVSSAGGGNIEFDNDYTIEGTESFIVPDNCTINGRGHTVSIRTDGSTSGPTLNLNDHSNIIVADVDLQNNASSGTNDDDCLSIEGSATKIWVHHVSFSNFYDEGAELRDCDFTDASGNKMTATFSYCDFNADDEFMMLIGDSSQSANLGNIWVAAYRNHFDGTANRLQRSPLLRCRWMGVNNVRKMTGGGLACIEMQSDIVGGPDVHCYDRGGYFDVDAATSNLAWWARINNTDQTNNVDIFDAYLTGDAGDPATVDTWDDTDISDAGSAATSYAKINAASCWVPGDIAGLSMPHSTMTPTLATTIINAVGPRTS